MDELVRSVTEGLVGEGFRREEVPRRRPEVVDGQCLDLDDPGRRHRDLDGAEEANMKTLMLSSKTARITTLVLRVLTVVILITSFVLLSNGGEL
ncbi:hypothetical protein FF1_041264 [Malus domestica]